MVATLISVVLVLIDKGKDVKKDEFIVFICAALALLYIFAEVSLYSKGGCSQLLLGLLPCGTLCAPLLRRQKVVPSEEAEAEQRKLMSAVIHPESGHDAEAVPLTGSGFPTHAVYAGLKDETHFHPETEASRVITELYGQRNADSKFAEVADHPHGVVTDVHDFRSFEYVPQRSILHTHHSDSPEPQPITLTPNLPPQLRYDTITDVRLSFASASAAACVDTPPIKKVCHWPYLLLAAFAIMLLIALIINKDDGQIAPLVIALVLAIGYLLGELFMYRLPAMCFRPENESRYKSIFRIDGIKGDWYEIHSRSTRHEADLPSTADLPFYSGPTFHSGPAVHS